MSKDEHVALRGSSPFRMLADETFEAVIADAEIVEAPAGTVLYDRGEDVGALHWIARGGVLVLRVRDRDERTALELVEHVRLVGEVEALLGRPAAARAEAIGDVRLVGFPVTGLARLFAEDVDFAMALLGSAASHIPARIYRIVAINHLTDVERVARWLCERAGKPAGSTEFVLPFEKRAVAESLLMAPESFSRALSRLNAVGVRVDRNKLRIADLGRLAVIAGIADESESP